MKRQFAKNLTTNWAVYLLSALITLFLTPYIISRLGQGAYGVWILVGAFSGYLGLFDFGIGYAVVRFVARYQTTGESDKRNEIVATSFYTAAALAVLVIAATVVIMVNAPHIFNLPPELVDSSRLVILLVGVSIALAFPLAVFSEALAGGLWRYDLFNAVSLAIALFQAGLTILFLELGFGLPGLGLAVLIGSAIGYIWRMRILFRLLPDLSIRLKHVHFAVFRDIGNYSFFSFLLILSGRIAFYSDSFVVGIFRSVEDIAVFGIAVKLVEYLRQGVFTLTRLFSPVAARYDPETDKASLRRLFYDGSRLNLLFSLPLSIGLFFWGGALIQLWLGDSFAYSETILKILLAGHILAFLQGIGGEILLGVGRHRLFAELSLLAAIINIALSVILVKKIGLAGVAWGTTIPLAAVSIGYLPLATLRLVGGTIRDFSREVLWPAIRATAFPAILIGLVSTHLNSLAAISLWGSTGAGLYCLTAYFWGLNSAERTRIKQFVEKINKYFP